MDHPRAAGRLDVLPRLAATCGPPRARPSSWPESPLATTSNPPDPPRPERSEHAEQILAGLGLDWDAVADLKARGVVA